jgi:peptidoglycan hydrolase-like protein with peptidoglycan-binding domain
MLGSAGAAVRGLQETLNYIQSLGNLAPALVVDGTFGPRTQARVIEFQQLANLTADGIVGPITSGALIGVVTYSLCNPAQAKAQLATLVRVGTGEVVTGRPASAI